MQPTPTQCVTLVAPETSYTTFDRVVSMTIFRRIRSLCLRLHLCCPRLCTRPLSETTIQRISASPFSCTAQWCLQSLLTIGILASNHALPAKAREKASLRPRFRAERLLNSSLSPGFWILKTRTPWRSSPRPPLPLQHQIWTTALPL